MFVPFQPFARRFVAGGGVVGVALYAYNEDVRRVLDEGNLNSYCSVILLYAMEQEMLLIGAPFHRNKI